MTVGKIPTAEIIAELKRRLADRADGEIVSDYEIAAEYLDYVQRLLREPTRRMITPDSSTDRA